MIADWKTGDESVTAPAAVSGYDNLPAGGQPLAASGDQSGRRALVTGTGGLGFQVASELARAGAHVIIAGRDPEKGAEAVKAITSRSSRGSVMFEQVDLASLESIRNLAGRLQSAPALDLLVNNAGIMSPPRRQTTADGFEAQFGVNYLGHFALTARLLPLLLRGRAPRVVSVTSLAHRYARMDFTDLQSERKYQPGVAYCRSKLAQALFVGELQRQSDRAGWGLTSVAAHPGFASTNLFGGGQQGRWLSHFLNTRIIAPLIGQSAEAGALPILHAATAPEVEPGGLFGPTGRFEMRGPPGPCQYARQALDQEVSARLWGISETLCGLEFAAGATGRADL